MIALDIGMDGVEAGTSARRNTVNESEFAMNVNVYERRVTSVCRELKPCVMERDKTTDPQWGRHGQKSGRWQVAPVPEPCPVASNCNLEESTMSKLICEVADVRCLHWRTVDWGRKLMTGLRMKEELPLFVGQP